LNLCLSNGNGEVFEGRRVLVLAGIQAQHTELALQIQHLLLRGLNLMLQVVELAR
jgi:hypothetical protein